MQTDIRPENMQRITTPELAKAFIEEQVSEIRAAVKDKKVLFREESLKRISEYLTIIK